MSTSRIWPLRCLLTKLRRNFENCCSKNKKISQVEGFTQRAPNTIGHKKLKNYKTRDAIREWKSVWSRFIDVWWPCHVDCRSSRTHYDVNVWKSPISPLEIKGKATSKPREKYFAMKFHSRALHKSQPFHNQVLSMPLPTIVNGVESRKPLFQIAFRTKISPQPVIHTIYLRLQRSWKLARLDNQEQSNE